MSKGSRIVLAFVYKAFSSFFLIYHLFDPFIIEQGFGVCSNPIKSRKCIHNTWASHTSIYLIAVNKEQK